MEHARDEQRGAVVIKQIAHGIMDPAGGIDGDLLLQHKAAINAAGTAAVESLVEHGQGVPVGRSALGRAIADRESGQGVEFFLHFAATHALEWRFAEVGLRMRRAGQDTSELSPHELDAFVEWDMSN